MAAWAEAADSAANYLAGALARTSLGSTPKMNLPRITVAWPGEVQKKA